MRMRVLVTGVTGQLGHDCVLELKDRGIEVQGVSSREFPLTDAEAMRRYCSDKPDLRIAIELVDVA